MEDAVVSDAIRALGCCATRIPESGQQCLTALIAMIKSPTGSYIYINLNRNYVTEAKHLF